jgi:hypothetical protein
LTMSHITESSRNADKSKATIFVEPFHEPIHVL